MRGSLAAIGLLSLLARQQAGPDSLLRLAEKGDARLVAAVRQYPDSLRAVLTRVLAAAAHAPDTAAANAQLSTARRLAIAYAAAWSDSFVVRQVRRFARWSPSERRSKARVDSLRAAGADALGAAGAQAAMRPWRESLRLAQVIGDSAGEAAAMANIGAAFYLDHALDSAERYLTRSRTLSERIGDYRVLGNAYVTLASVAKDRGQFANARLLYSRAFALRPRTGDDRGAAADENNLGLVAQELGDTAGARRGFEAALGRNRRAARLSIAAVNLVNLANLATAQGAYTRAAALYREALAIHEQAKARASMAPVLHNLGLIEMRRADFGAARDALGRAAALYESLGPVADAAEARADLAQAQSAMGDLQSSLTNLRKAEGLASGDSQPAMAAHLALARADIATDFNAFGEAERGYSAAALLFDRLHDSVALGDAQQGLGSLLLRRGNAGGARDVFETVLTLRQNARDRHATALTRLLLGSAMAAQGDSNTAVARRELNKARVELHALGDVVNEASALGALGSLELMAGSAAVAEATYAHAITLAGVRAAPGLSAELLYGHARALAARGDLDGAALDLHRSLDAIERIAGGIRTSERRAGFRADKWEVYAQLALIERTRGHDAAAFGISERLRSRQMLDMMAEGRVADAAQSGDSLVALEQDLRHQIAELERTLETRTAGRADTRRRAVTRGPAFGDEPAVATRAALDAAHRSYDDVLVRLRDRAPAYRELVHPRMADAAAVAKQLKPDEAFIEYLVSDSTTLAFVVRAGQVKAIDLGVGRRALASAVDFTRETIGRNAKAGEEELWRAPLRRLHRLLIDPIAQTGLLGGAKSLLIAPHAELHYLPFAALMGSGGAHDFLVSRFDVAYVPSASLWLALVGRNSAVGSRGLLALAPRPDALPASRDEVNSLRTIYGAGATVLTGREATESAFRARAPHAAIVHLATFGVLNKHNPLFSFVEFAPDARGDGRFDVRDVFGLALHARLVVLSACQTALASGETADVPSGDDWIGLVRGFLFAGADNVIATLWPIGDRVAANSMHGFYRELAAGRPLASALADVQRRAIRDRAAPVSWAGLTLVGAVR